MIADLDLDRLLALAERAARAAGDALIAHRAQWSAVEAVIGREVKVAADKQAEALILDMLTAQTQIPILSEEAGWVGDEDRHVAWAVDPLDGSVNYIKGYPHCAVSIALMRGRTPVLGVVHCFLLDECFTGVVGRGAWLNGAVIAVSDVAFPDQAILNTGIPARAAIGDEAFSAFMADMLRWRKVRMIGSAAAALAYVAAGRADAYRESGAMLWDVAAGCALVNAAGGVATLTGKSLDRPLLVEASNAVLGRAGKAGGGAGAG